jgi:hypothetical protein
MAMSVTNGSRSQAVVFKYFICRIHYWADDDFNRCSDCVRLFGDWEAML